MPTNQSLISEALVDDVKEIRKLLPGLHSFGRNSDLGDLIFMAWKDRYFLNKI